MVVRRSSGSLRRQSAPKAPPWRSPGFARSRVAEATRAGELRRGEARVRVARGTRVGTRVGTRARFARLARVAGGARGRETDSRSGGALREKKAHLRQCRWLPARYGMSMGVAAANDPSCRKMIVSASLLTLLPIVSIDVAFSSGATASRASESELSAEKKPPPSGDSRSRFPVVAPSSRDSGLLTAGEAMPLCDSRCISCADSDPRRRSKPTTLSAGSESARRSPSPSSLGDVLIAELRRIVIARAGHPPRGSDPPPGRADRARVRD